MNHSQLTPLCRLTGQVVHGRGRGHTVGMPTANLLPDPGQVLPEAGVYASLVEVDTLGGLVFSQLHTIPKDGTVLDVEAYGLDIHVEHIAERRIVAATVRKAREEAAPAASDT